MSETVLKLPGRGKTPKATFQFLTQSRVDLGLSQTALAKMCDVAQAQVSDWERGIDMPNMIHIPKISKALHIGIGKLAEETNIFFSKSTT